MSKSGLGQLFKDIKKSDFETLATKWEREKSWKENAQHIALELMDFIEENNLTQKAIAAQMGVSPQVVNKWLKGEENFTLETIGKIETILGRKLIQVISGAVGNTVSSDETILIEERYRKPVTASSGKFKQAKVIPIHAKYSLANAN